MVTAVDQLERLIDIARDNFSQERFEKVENMYEHFQERILVAPASNKEHFHNCYAGGYLDHVHNVIEGTMHVTKAFKALGGEIDFTMEEAIFSAMHHDLSKLGDLEEPYYIPQDSDWHRENRGELYKTNPNLKYMIGFDRTFYILQSFGIRITDKEFKAIRVADGLFYESNKPYFISYAYPPRRFHTNLHYVVHMADWMAAIGEYDAWRQNG